MGNETSREERDPSEILYSLDEAHSHNPRVM
jgi:hypothetical protein